MNNKILEVLIKKQPSSILLIESRYSDVQEIVFGFIKSLNCDNKVDNFFCNNCKNCKKINSCSYYDMHIINKNNEGIVKENILEIINSFRSSALESKGNKFLIIFNIEQANKFVINSLLKSIEEPSKNTYYIFITRNDHQVLPTIKSRCEIFKILPNLNFVIQQLIQANIDTIYHDDLINIYYNYNEMIYNFSNGSFLKILEIAKNINQSYNNYPLQKEILTEFKKLDYFSIIDLINLVSYKKENRIKDSINNLISLCKLNINKTLIFNQLINIIFNL